MRSRMAVRACSSVSTISRISGAASSSPETISIARRVKPPTALPNRTPNVRSSPRIWFSSLIRMRTSTSRAERRERIWQLARVLILTCLNHPVRTICARPAASFRSVLLGPHLQGRVRVPGIDAEDGQAAIVELIPEPDRKRAGLHADPFERGGMLANPGGDRLWAGRHLLLGRAPSFVIDDADRSRDR